MDSCFAPELPYNAILIRYSEIATKGRNRRQFEKRLIKNAKRCLSDLGRLRVVSERGRIFLLPREKDRTFTVTDCRSLRKRSRLICGLSSISPGFLVTPELAAIEDTIYSSFPGVFSSYEKAHPPAGPIQYRMRARRSNKSFPMTSTELEIHFAERLLEEYPRLEVNLDDAELDVGVEIRRDHAFVWYEQIPGPGGLPTGIGGKVLALLSGGIDSPVACYQMMRRSCRSDFVTFHSSPYTPPQLIDKVAALAGKLNLYQGHGRLIAVNLLPLQKAIRDNCRDRYRTLLYRRGMMRLSTVIAHTVDAEALVTGDNLGQVASQTLSNLSAISSATHMVIHRPLLAADKMETVATAEQIGTMEESRNEIPDSCTVFAPSNPATGVAVRKIEQQESCLDLPGLMKKCIEQTAEVSIDDLSEKPIRGLTDSLRQYIDEMEIRNS